MKLSEVIKESLIVASRTLNSDIVDKILYARENERGKYSRMVLDAILNNIKAAKESNIPLCQDTGLLWVSVLYGSRSSYDISKLDSEIKEGAERAFEEGYFRKSIVEDPIYKRINTGNNMPIDITYEVIDSSEIRILFLLKGFGSENVSSVRMLNPTGGEESIVDAIKDIVMKAGGKPCPPIIFGIGVGGTLDRAAYLSKKAFFKHDDTTPLEKRILNEVNSTNIGAGGLGGEYTCLDVKMLSEPTHIAALPLAVNVSCWASRKAEIVIKGGESGYKIISSVL